MCTSAIQVLSELLVEWITMYRLSKANLYFTDSFVTLVNLDTCTRDSNAYLNHAVACIRSIDSTRSFKKKEIY